MDPERYGVLEIKNNKPVSLIEKPSKFISPWAVTGIYTYDSSVVKRAKMLMPSERNELEITDLNKEYMNNRELDSRFFDEGVIWMDTGTFESMKDASEFIAAIQKRQDILVGSPELAAFKNQWISKKDIEMHLHYSNQYTESLLRLID